MSSLSEDYAGGVFDGVEPPCLSLYQPTHRSHPDKQQDRIRFRNLIKVLDDSLRRKYSARDVRPLLEPFQKLAEDEGFWNRSLEGLAVLGAAALFRIYRLPRPVRELAVVANSFHVKPLLRILQSADRYQILGLQRRQIRMFEGNRDAIVELELPPAVAKALDEQAARTEEPPPGVWMHTSGTGEAVRYGQASKSDRIDIETERFFRAADRAVLEYFSQPSGMPLLLAALPEHQGWFRRLSRNPFLMSDGIDAHPDALDSLQQKAWRVVEPYYLTRLAGLVEMFADASSKGLGSSDLAEVADNAAAGRVATLLVDANREVPGRIGSAGDIELGGLADPEVDDLLDDLAQLVLKNRGQVVIVPAERMPTQTGIAAIYRY